MGLNIRDHRLDIRDGRAFADVLRDVQPELVFHLAAQSLVRRSYRNPLETWSTNVIGTVNLLEACRVVDSVRAIVVVTSDKCYENRGSAHRYRETDRLGGHDPYSASKAAEELIASSYRSAFFQASGAPLVATARAGNVIGGGDWAEDRLIPDVIRAIMARSKLEVRSPQSTRPWQHVLECLSGYLLLGQRLLEERGEFADAWNFGPRPEGNRSVAQVLECLTKHWPELTWEAVIRPQPYEASFLQLDIGKAQTQLGWSPVWGLEEALAATSDWYRTFLSTSRIESASQIGAFIAKGRAAGFEWFAS